MADYKDVDLKQYPQILQDFAQYKLDMECSKNTISDYLMDLTLFLRYITLSRAHASDFSDIHSIDITHADLALLDSIKPNEVRDFLTYTNLQRNNACQEAFRHQIPLSLPKRQVLYRLQSMSSYSNSKKKCGSPEISHAERKCDIA